MNVFVRYNSWALSNSCDQAAINPHCISHTSSIWLSLERLTTANLCVDCTVSWSEPYRSQYHHNTHIWKYVHRLLAISHFNLGTTYSEHLLFKHASARVLNAYVRVHARVQNFCGNIKPIFFPFKIIGRSFFFFFCLFVPFSLFFSLSLSFHRLW